MRAAPAISCANVHKKRAGAYRAADNIRHSLRQPKSSGSLSGAVDASAGVVLTHPLPGRFVAPARDGEAGGCRTAIWSDGLTGRNHRLLARPMHGGGVSGSRESHQEAHGKSGSKNSAHDGRFQSSAARNVSYVFGSAVDDPQAPGASESFNSTGSCRDARRVI